MGVFVAPGPEGLEEFEDDEHPAITKTRTAAKRAAIKKKFFFISVSSLFDLLTLVTCSKINIQYEFGFSKVLFGILIKPCNYLFSGIKFGYCRKTFDLCVCRTVYVIARSSIGFMATKQSLFFRFFLPPLIKGDTGGFVFMLYPAKI